MTARRPKTAASEGVGPVQQEFPEIVRRDVPLAPLTRLRLGGPARFLVEPRDAAELAAVVRHSAAASLPLRVLGSGARVLAPDGGFPGAVLRLSAPAFSGVRVEGTRVRAGAGAALTELIAAAVRHGLAGLETLAGLPDSVGGAVRRNAADKSASVGQFVRAVEQVTPAGEADRRPRDELRFGDGTSGTDDSTVLAVEFELEPDSPDAIVRRLRKAWIVRAAGRPYPYQVAARMFRDPRGQTAASLVERAGQARASQGQVEVSERNSNYLVAKPGATARDAARLIEVVRDRVSEATGVALERELEVW